MSFDISKPSVTADLLPMTDLSYDGRWLTHKPSGIGVEVDPLMDIGAARRHLAKHVQEVLKAVERLSTPAAETRTVTFWFNVYEPQFKSGQWSLSREEADLSAQILAKCGHERIACIEHEITFAIGEGLSELASRRTP